MRKYWLFILFLCLQIAARGQTGYGYHYWFDNDMTNMTEGTSLSPTWHIDVPMEGLDESLHLLHLQVQDSEGEWSVPVTRYFLKIGGETEVVGTYWFDDDYENRRTLPAPGGVMMVDVSGIDDGMHYLHYTATRGETVSSVRTALFVKYSDTLDFDYRIWAEDAPERIYTGKLQGKPIELDVSALMDGLHVLYVQVVSPNSASMPTNKMFIKVPQTDGIDYLTCLMFIDEELYKQEEVATSGGLVAWTLEVDDLSQGMHSYMVQVVTPSGAASDVQYGFFFRDTKTEEYQALQCFYMVDGDVVVSKAGTLSDGLYHFDLDVSELEDGLHRLSYWLADGTGVMTEMKSTFFTKIPLGGNGISHYEYWLNTGYEERIETTVEPRLDVLSLIKLLPVATQPLRSSKFQFTFKNNKPLIYAKNEFHIRFYDASNRFIETTKEFVDEKVSQQVTPVGELEATQTFNRVEENGIRWYTVTLEEGDSVAFKSSQVCTMQLFSPSGEEVYSASGSTSVAFDGCHTWEDGTYYLAVHDVTGSQSTMTLDFVSIDRYAICEYTPNHAGIPSIANISIVGNGFDETTRVGLVRNGNAIWAESVSVENIANLTACFNLPQETDLGQYDLRVVYSATDSITISKGVSLEEADSISDISIQIEGNPYFIAGGSATYSIRFTNHSNIPVYSLPFTLTIDCQGDVSNVPYLKFETDFKKQARAQIRRAFRDQCTAEELAALEYAVLGDDDLTMFYVDTISEVGKAYLVGDFVLPRLDGNSTITIPFTIKKVNHDLTLYAFTKPHWSISDFVNINHVNNDGGGGSGSDSGGGSGGSGSGDSGGSSGSGGSGSGGSGGDSGASGSGSGGSGSGDSGGGSGSGGSGSGSGSSSGGNSGGNSGSGGSGSGAGNGSGSGGSGGGLTSFCEDPCALRLAVDCFMSIIETVVPLGSLGEWVRECAGDVVKNSSSKIFSDYFCSGEMPDLSNIQKDPAPVVIDITASVLGCLGWNIAKGLIGGRVVKMVKVATNCVFKPLAAWANSCPDEGGGATATPIHSYDPNEIYGYTSESGSKALKKGLTDVYYTIQFENDITFATAAAHDIYLADTLDANKYDFSTFKPTSIKIGDKYTELSGEKNFVITIDMRPETNAVAQVEGIFDEKKGIAKWYITSLNPMTMEPTDDPMDGVLPVNTTGNGIGEVSYNISLKKGLPNGTQIPNRAGIVFDNNATIMTPTWTNTVDAIAPTSHISACEIKNDTTATLRFEGTDNLSGVWKYDVYVQYEEDASWYKCREGVTDKECDVRIYEGINHGFYVVATDSAGNVEAKEAAREYTLDLFEPTEDSDLELELAKGWNWVSHNLNASLDVSTVKAAALRILGQEEETMKDIALGFVGDLTELKPAQGYKIQMEEADEIGLSGKLYNLSFKSISLAEGWNWIGYPLAHTMTIAQALEHFTPEEGDYIVGQSGFAQYADGEWLGTITTLNPGKGYLYKSGSRKQMFFNSTATLSSRVEAKARRIADQNPWICDMYRYPNVMPVTASLYSKGVAEEADDYFVAAFCGNECRGVGKTVKGLVMMSVYGEGGETITFKVIDKETDQLLDVAESVAFSGDVLGTFSEPYRLTIGGEATGVIDLAANAMKITPSVIRDKMTVTVGSERINRLTIVSAGGAVVGDWKKLPDGSTVDVSGLSAGVYVVTAKVGKQMLTKKVMKVTE